MAEKDPSKCTGETQRHRSSAVSPTASAHASAAVKKASRGNLHPLGDTGRPRGVNDVGDGARYGWWRGPVCDAQRRKGGPCGADGKSRWRRLVRARGDHQCGPAVGHDLRTAEIWIGDRQRNERDPRPQTAQCRHHEVHRIADQQGNPIPGLDAFLEQASGHSPSCGAQLAPGQRAIQVLDGGPIRGSIGVVSTAPSTPRSVTDASGSHGHRYERLELGVKMVRNVQGRVTETVGPTGLVPPRRLVGATAACTPNRNGSICRDTSLLSHKSRYQTDR